MLLCASLFQLIFNYITMSIHKLIVFLILSTFFYASCQQSNDQASTNTSSHVRDSASNSKYYEEPGYVKVVDSPQTQVFRPTLPLDQAAFKTEKKEIQSRLENEFQFMFDRNWKVDGRVLAGEDKVYRRDQEEYTFNRDGSFTSIIDGKQDGGTWKGRMQNTTPVITIFPNDLHEKVSEWFVKNTGKNMVWSGTSSYKDNAIMVHFVLKK